MKPTPRGAGVLRRAQQLGLSAFYNRDGETVTITGATRTIFTTVSHADAYLQGYFDGSARADRSAAEARQCPDCCGGMEMTYVPTAGDARGPTDETRVETRPGLRRPRLCSAAPPPLARPAQGLDSEAAAVAASAVRYRRSGASRRTPRRIRW